MSLWAFIVCSLLFQIPVALSQVPSTQTTALPGRGPRRSGGSGAALLSTSPCTGAGQALSSPEPRKAGEEHKKSPLAEMRRRSSIVSVYQVIIFLSTRSRAEHGSSETCRAVPKPAIWHHGFVFRGAAHRAVLWSFLGLFALRRSHRHPPCAAPRAEGFLLAYLLIRFPSAPSQRPAPFSSSSQQGMFCFVNETEAQVVHF